ncbi:MAG: hypothetical protein PHF14_12150 [Verrucomicrobiota bacterium]|jgi:hypothetical protein|nr:hypothetical protein [Verrucomicrobiota bacterium]
MKSVSAAIVVLAGCILIAVGSLVRHVDTQLFCQVVGCGVGALGLWKWFEAFHRE